MNPSQRKLYKEIDKLLWEEWNPIGGFVPEDEYQSYVPAILRLKMQNADEQTIARKLFEYETISMELSGSWEGCVEIAKRVLELE